MTIQDKLRELAARFGEIHELGESIRSESETKLTELRAKIKEISDISVEGQVRQKIGEVYTETEKIMKNALNLATILGVDRSTVQKCTGASPSYSKNDFLQDLRASYEFIVAGYLAIKRAPNKSAVDLFLLESAKHYANIRDMKTNTETLIKSYVRQEQTKSARIAPLRKEIEDIENAVRESKEWVENESLDLVAELDGELEKMLQRTAVNELPHFSTEYGRAELVLPTCIKERLPIPQKSHKYIKNFSDNSRLFTFEEDAVTLSISGEERIELGEKSNFSVVYDVYETEGDALRYQLEAIIMQFLACYPDSYKKIAAIHDNGTSSEFVEIMTDVGKCCEKDAAILSKNDRSGFDYGDTMRGAFEQISNVIIERRSMVSSGSYKNILEYNEANPTNIQPLILFCIKDIDLADKHRHYTHQLAEIIRVGNAVGVYTAMINEKGLCEKNTKLMEAADARNRELFAHSICLGTRIEEDSLAYFLKNGNPSFDFFKKQMSRGQKALDFLEFHSRIPRSEADYTEKMIVPIGNHGSEPVFVSFESQSPLAHASVEGMNGVGKTTLLHSIILGAAYHYSPEELEIWIFDFKKGGKDFEPYKRLKHVKYIAVNSNIGAAQDLLDMVTTELAKKGSIKGTRNARTLVVIDEYAIMNEKGIDTLVAMAKLIRTYGASLLLSTQAATHRKINAEVSHKFEMYKSDEYNLIETAGKYPELTRESRLALYQGGEKKPLMVRYAFVADAVYSDGNHKRVENLVMDEGIGHIIQTINDRYPDAECDPYILGKVSPVTYEDRPAEGVIFEKDGDFRISLGRKEFAEKGQVEQYYRMDTQNRMLLLLGDSYRASNVERLMAEALCEKNVKVYYIDFNYYEDNIMRKFAKEHPDIAPVAPRDIVGIVQKAYDEYMRRRDMIWDEEPIRDPMVLFFHGAGEVKSSISDAERFMARQKDTAPRHEPISRSTMGGDAILSSGLSVEKLLEMQARGEGTHTAILARMGMQKAAEDPEPQPQKEYPSVEKMLREMVTANTKCKIRIVVHFDSFDSRSKYNGIFPETLSEYKDAIVIPRIPKEEEVASTEDTARWIEGLASKSAADAYKQKMQPPEDEPEQVREKFNYLVLIDEHKPKLYFPYETLN